jgi:signal transduction histidine kinase
VAGEPNLRPGVARLPEGAGASAALAASAATAIQLQAAALNLMEDAVAARDQLATRNEELRREIAVRERTEAELRASHELLRSLTARLHAVREEESTRIARGIHDELGQQLTCLKMDLRWLERGLEDLRDPGAAPLLEKTMAATELVNTTIQTVQQIAAELRPTILDKLGLMAALRRETGQFQQTTGIACRLHGPEVEPRPPAPVGIACFRVFQEAMTNVARHAAATVVEVEFQMPPGGFGLEIRDNGRGIPPAVAETCQTLGLLGMRERAHALGGEVTVQPRAAGGTVVRLWIPTADAT